MSPEGTTRAFGAVRSVAEVLPVSFLWAPLLALPPVQWIGERVYRSVQNSWRPDEWREDSPWMRIYRNARLWVG